MQVPAAMFIESAVGTLLQKQADPDQKRWLDDEVRELASAVGGDAATRLGITLTPADTISKDFTVGFQLGLETARTMIATSSELIGKAVNKDNIL